MRATVRAAAVVLLALLVLLVSSSARAAPRKRGGARPPASAPGAAPASPPSGASAAAGAGAGAGDDAAQSSPSQRDVAREHFERAMLLLEDEQWDAALSELELSRRLFPTRAAARDAAVCLRKLHRYDEALDAFEALLRDFPSLAPADRALAQREIARLQDYVGAVAVTTDPGATIALDERVRGTVPLATPLRAGIGTHVLRVYKDGFAPFEQRIDVVARRTTAVAVRLMALSTFGRLRVTEKDARQLDVVVDGVVVGRTPWEGSMSVGSHMVLLRGAGTLGTPPSPAPVQQGQLTTLTLASGDLDASLRVVPVPANARVALDGIVLGRGTWEGRVFAGPHRVEVAQDGFFVHDDRFGLAHGERRALDVELERDPTSPLWLAEKRPKLVVDLDLGVGWTPVAIGGKPDDNCADACDRHKKPAWLVVVDAGYQTRIGFGFGLSLGAMTIAQTILHGDDDVTPVATPPGLTEAPSQRGSQDDVLHAHGWIVGGWAAQHWVVADRFPLTARLGLGAMFGSVEDVRNGTYTDHETPPVTYTVPERRETPSFLYFVARPEVRAGVRVFDHVELSIGFEAVILRSLSDANWQDQQKVGTPVDGPAQSGLKRVIGKTMLWLVPSLGLRYDFDAPFGR